MSSTNYRLFNRICHSKVFNSIANSRIILTQKQCIATISNIHNKICILNPNKISNNNLFTNNYTFSFTTKSKDDEEFDTDSDLSDLSDFSDLDSDSDEEDKVKTKQQKPNDNQWKFGHSDIPEEALMKDRLIISNLNFSTNRNDLWELCENYGTVIDVHLPANKNRDFHNRGFGFVTFETDKYAANALENVAGIMFNSRQLRSGYARKDTEKTSVHNPTSQKLRDRSDFQFQSNSGSVTAKDMSGNVQDIGIGNVSKTLNETVITVNGLPGNVNLAQITKMFNEFGTITNITFSPYQMFGHSLMNAIVNVKLQNININKESNNNNNNNMSFQKEQDIKDRSVEKGEIGNMRKNINTNTNRNVNQNQKIEGNKVGGIDPDILAKEIDELLADTDDENESGSDAESDSDSDDSSSDDENDNDNDNQINDEENSSSSDSDDDDDRIQ